MDTKLTKTQDTVLNGIVRHILTAAGGALVARGSLAESASGEWSGVGRDDLQRDSDRAVVCAIGGHHLLDVHQDRQGGAGLSWGGFGSGYLLLHHPPRVPRILATHGPRAFGEAFALGLEGIELFVP